MYQINFNNPIHVHFIGIGGISMSGLAEILHTFGFTTSGSDRTLSSITSRLEDQGMKIYGSQIASNITDDIDLVVYTAAIKSDNEEYQEVVARNIPIMDRAELVGQVMKQYENSIAVAGTHGKTTTTSMIALMLLEGELDPTISVGGILESIGGSIRIGQSKTFITEACEYTNSYLKFNPTRSIILNVEEDHLDFFKDIHEIRESFLNFSKKLPDDGILFINGEIEDPSYFTKDLSCKVISYSIKDLNENVANASLHYSATNISYNEFGQGSYDLMENGKKIARIQLGLVGEHNISNSLPSIALGLNLNLSIDCIQRALLKYTGTNRRFQKKGILNGVTIIDDYAHHPTEIEATLVAVKNYPHKESYCVFQPHTYTRTNAFLKEFASSLLLADHIILTDIYAAREQNTLGVSSMDLVAEIEKLGKKALYFPTFKEIEEYLKQHCTHGDLLITMGAGDVVNIGENLLKQ